MKSGDAGVGSLANGREIISEIELTVECDSEVFHRARERNWDVVKCELRGWASLIIERENGSLVLCGINSGFPLVEKNQLHALCLRNASRNAGAYRFGLLFETQTTNLFDHFSNVLFSSK